MKLSGKLELNWVNKNKTLIVSDYEKAKDDCVVLSSTLYKVLQRGKEIQTNSFDFKKQLSEIWIKN